MNLHALSKSRVSVMVPSEVWSALDKHSQITGQSMGEVVALALCHHLKVGVRPVAPAPEPRKAPSVIELVGRGYSANQIAAMTRLPYREVLAQLGKQIDAAMPKRKRA